MLVIGPIQFDSPLWLLLAPATSAIAWMMARKSLSGLGPVTRRAAITIRIVVLTLLAAALAEPSWRRVSEDVSVTLIVDTSDSMPGGVADRLGEYLKTAAESARKTDRLGVISTAKDARARAIPSRRVPPSAMAADGFRPGEWLEGARDATDLAAGVRLGVAIKPEDAAGRLMLFSDGNETQGSLLAAAAAAKAAGVPIDVLPIPVTIEREVSFDSLIAPATGRKGQTVNLRMLFTATRPTRGRLSMMVNNEPFDLTPGAEGLSDEVTLDAGKNVITIPVMLSQGGRPQEFKAIFEPEDEADDARLQNNSALGVTFVSTEGKILIYATDPGAAEPLVSALDPARLDAEVRSPADAHRSLLDLQGYDAIVLFDVAAFDFDLRQQQELAAFVHDSGGGLIMVGGPQSFGAGGWLGSPVADALPVKLDPPQKRQIPRGALVLVMHSCEIPEGNYWGKQTALAAVGTLSRLDLAGVIEYAWNAATVDGTSWTFPLSVVGDRAAITAAISSMQYGDMPDFEAIMTQTLNALAPAKAAQKHCIIISDGDPSGPSQGLINQFIAAKISISTVCVFPHGGQGDVNKMRAIAQATGGTAYLINTQGQLATLPQIFIKEAQIVRRALIWEGDPFSPALVNVAAEPMRGIGPSLPPISGYVVTADREGLSLVTVRGQENDPIVAQWQHGLGRSIAFTSDATTRWSPAWVSWAQFQSFWEQHIRWAMRPSGSANVSIVTQTEGDRTRIIATALDAAGESMNFARFSGRVTLPDLSARDLELSQTGPGRYEGLVDSGGSGSYLATLRYDAPKSDGSGIDSGTVQAAVTRPFADEYRALSDNAPLLAQVAETTGGRVLTGDPVRDDLFGRAGLDFPVALRPIWLALALAALTAFLLDVGIRRVRIDIPAMIAAVRKAARRPARAAAGAPIGALKAARETTRQQIARRTRVDDSTAGAKFEATADQLKRASASPVEKPGQPSPSKPSQPTRPTDGKQPQEEAGMSRLLKAKQRARDTMSDQPPKDST